jgi:hypothetical protein
MLTFQQPKGCRQLCFTDSIAARPTTHHLSNGEYIVIIDCLRQVVPAVFRRVWRRPGTALVIFVCLAAQCEAQKVDLVASGSPVQPSPADPAITKALAAISPSSIEQTITTLVGFKNRDTLSSMEKDLPPGTGVTAAAGWIQQQFENIAKACGGCLEVKVDTFTEPAQSGPHSRITQPTTVTNVYAILRGSDPGQARRMYLVTGHYDTRVTDVMDTHSFAPGANDDSSGTAVSLECARVLSQHRWPATLVFAAVAGEEQGLYGSKHLAALARQEGWELEGVLNNDIVGGDTTPGDTLQNKALVRIFSEGVPANATPEETKRILTLGNESDSPSRELAREIVAVDATYSPASSHSVRKTPRTGAGITSGNFKPVLEFRLDRYLRGGDHYSFNQQGFAAVRFTEWRENFDHQHQNVRVENGKQYGDLLKYVDFHYVANVAMLNAATLATLASAPGNPQNVRVETKALDNNTTLKWLAPANSGSNVRYQIVWRETEAPNWEQFEPAPSSSAGPASSTDPEQSATLPISKDNVLFGVRACNKAGQCSPAVAPVPER